MALDYVDSIVAAVTAKDTMLSTAANAHGQRQSTRLHTPASHLAKRGLSAGATAGTVVAVVAAVALAAFCLYPVIVYRLKRRQRGRDRHRDVEATITGQSGVQLPDTHRPLSSVDSFKQDGDVSRGDVDAAAATQTLRTRAIAPPANTDFDDGSWPVTQPTDAPMPPTAPLPFYYGEYMPVSEVIDNRSGVLKGTSADYYSPSVPSEAFGMVTTPSAIDANHAGLSGSRSLRYNVRQMFSRNTGRHHAAAHGLNSAAMTASAGRLPTTSISALHVHDASAPDQATPIQPRSGPSDLQLPAAAMLTVSHTGLPANASPTPYQLDTINSPSSLSSQPQQRTGPAFNQTSWLPSSSPAPGTVNPMDVMPPSTDSEIWHRAKARLPAWSFASTPQGNAAPQGTTSPPSPSLPQPPVQPQPSHAHLPDSMQTTDVTNHGGLSNPQTSPRNDHLSPSTGPSSSRRPSYPSDQSPPFPGPASLDTSVHDSPSTQVDSLSPESIISSDFRHSTSPQPASSSLTSGSVFRCEEPGCNQTFGAPHKLKHHVRYHRREHKCPYPSCGKGFGTKTHLQRHINDRHEKKKKFHCTVPGCDYSKTKGNAFPRKDNWKRHMIKIHNLDQSNLPEPVEADQLRMQIHVSQEHIDEEMNISHEHMSGIS